MNQQIEPSVSIIVPVYNTEQYIRLCIDSLVNQTLREIEIILVDDGSTDLSSQICDEYANYDTRIRVIHKKNAGLGMARNSGLEIAKGKYIGFIDSDDFTSPKMFSTLYKNAVSNEADVSYCILKKFTENNELVKCKSNNSKTRTWKGKEQIENYILDRIGLPPISLIDNLYGASVCCGIFRREIIKNWNIMFESERDFIAEDLLFNIEFVSHCNVVIHEDVALYFYRCTPQSLTTTYRIDRFDKNCLLYHEMCRRLKYKYSEERIFNSTARYFLTFTRIAIIQEVLNIKTNGIKHAIKKIKEICNNVELIEILNVYEYRKLPFKYMVFCFLEKRKAVLRLIILTYLYYLKK
ncbi:glycosyltransferase [Hungatella hathewayi]|uniref:glycosyltransferase n=1 Tax=Hungatella hathewayi TaxID=154046 RepID=UPI00210D864A|nr:glycosyltransferase [Hungatella hathewayi]MCQ5386541.1 glycosyltransferase [Hungatella hathewayi]